MSSEGVDKGKRRFLIGMTSLVGGVGAAGAAWPFVSYWMPSAKARAAGAPVLADISKLEPGQRMTVKWRKKPVWIVRRTEQNLNDLPGLNDKLADPESQVTKQQPGYIKGDTRSIKPEYLVAVGICTHLGCSPSYRPDLGSETPPNGEWKGGFFCPCHGSYFDLAGRVYSGVPAPINLEIPPHKFLSDTEILVGVDPEGVA